MLLWSSFIALILVFLALDLGVFHRKDHVVGIKESLRWTAIWASLALCFSVFVYFAYDNHWFELGTVVDAVDGRVNTGASATEKYLTGYLVEQSLSVDNLFVIAMIFGSFAVPAIYRHRVLFWGIIGALVMRGAMIGIGAQLIASFHWVMYVFGGFLILTSLKMLFTHSAPSDPSENIVVRLAKRFLPVTDHYHGHQFVAIHEQRGTRMLTPLAIALLMVETTDLIFAVDSIPAIFAITADPFIVFTSNIFAILGLRSLFFALSGMLDRFTYLRYSLAAILFVVGGKMFCEGTLRSWAGDHANLYLLLLVFALLGGGVGASFLIRTRPSTKSL